MPLDKDWILRIMLNLAKNVMIPKEVEEMIETHTKSYGKAKLIL